MCWFLSIIVTFTFGLWTPVKQQRNLGFLTISKNSIFTTWTEMNFQSRALLHWIGHKYPLNTKNISYHFTKHLKL